MFEKIIDSVDKMSASKYTVTSGLLAAGCIKNIFQGEDQIRMRLYNRVNPHLNLFLFILDGYIRGVRVFLE